MNSRFRIRAGLAAAVAAVLISGAAWRGLAASPSPVLTPATAMAQAPVITGRAAATVNGSRDSYADIVKAVAPAVVTIRVEGKAAVSPTQFEGDDDFLRRFFGDRFGEGPGRTPLRP